MQTGSVLIKEVRGSGDLAAVVDLCNGFLSWVRDRYGEKSWIVDRYYDPEKWGVVLSSRRKRMLLRAARCCLPAWMGDQLAA